ncbi:MAG: type VII secretion protein EccCa [Micromonosporaceae bacterium]|nr:type VII secretion protein EccCa [Micromonosporaceae bacterium]
MGTVIIKRQPRRPGPVLPEGDLQLEAPPTLPTNPPTAWTQLLTTVPMLAGSVAMALMFTNGRGGTLGYVTGAMFGVSMLGMVGAQFFGQSGKMSKRESMSMRREYLRGLGQLRRGVRRTIKEQRRAMVYRHPDPDTLWWVADGPRLWERRSTDSDFAVIRIGLGPLRLATPLRPSPTAPVEELEPLSASALRRFVTTYAVVKDLPVAVTLRGFARVYVRGEAERARALVRAILAQAAVFHAPEDVLIAGCYAPDNARHWDWLKWLPHALHPEEYDACGQVRLASAALHVMEERLDEVLGSRPRFNPNNPPSDGPHLIVVIDGGETAGSQHLMTEGGIEGVTIIDVSGRPPRNLDDSVLILDLDPPPPPSHGLSQAHSSPHQVTLSITTMDGSKTVGTPDWLSLASVEALARQLSPLRLSAASHGEEPLAGVTDLEDLLEVGDPYQFEPERAWRLRPNRDRLRVPIGVSPDGLPVELDIKESAQDGMGPHGLLVGATGSGKSEVLRTLVLALAVTHSPEVLNFVLVDFKGGATFTKLDRLPHTSAVITNLADEISLVDRMEAAINGELIRRQELLRKAGNYASARDYERAREAGAQLAPLPSLFIICDEFSELLTAKPEFIDMFVQIGRVGRSLGVHLLLASQRLEEGRLRGLDVHLSYRVGLRVFSAIESRVVLGVADAAELPRSPGHGYLKFGSEPMTRFKAAYVSGPYRASGHAAARASGQRLVPAVAYVPDYVEPIEPAEAPVVELEPETDDALAESVLDILVDRMEMHGPPAHQVWLPPLDRPLTLDEPLGPLVADPQRGLTTTQSELVGRLRIPVAIVDKPFEQRRDLLWLSLAGAGGHVVIVGGTQSGKSTLLRTLVCSLALTHTPAEAQVYCLDFGGGAILSLADLPHVGAAFARTEADQIRRTIAEIYLMLETREQQFTANRIDSMASYRDAKRGGRFAEDPFGDVFLVIDGWGAMRSEYEDLEATVTELAARGLALGVHVIVSAGRWMELRPAVRDLLGTKLELRLGDPTDSVHGRRVAANVPAERPGRGITPDGLHSLTILPRIDANSGTTDLAAGIDHLVTAVRNAWQGAPAPAVRMLPARVPFESLPQPAAIGRQRWRIPIGIAENDLGPVYLDFGAEPHCILFADIECGKTMFLRSLARSITERYSPNEACVITIDYRRTLLGVVPEDYLIGYASNSQAAESVVNQITTAMRERLPGSDITPEQLRNRSWWSGPDLFLFVDDYDLVVGGSMNPLMPLLEYAMQARDIGLHVIITRRSGGAGRASYETFLSRLRELGTPGIVMSGEREEGALIGNVRPSRMPPGRGWFVTRREGARLIQLAWLPTDDHQ